MTEQIPGSDLSRLNFHKARAICNYGTRYLRQYRQASPRQEELSRRNQSDQWNYDPAKVGHTKRDSLGILNIPMSATEREIKLQYRRLAKIYHPDKFDPTTTEISMFKVQEHFKQINNAYEYLWT